MKTTAAVSLTADQRPAAVGGALWRWWGACRTALSTLSGVGRKVTDVAALERAIEGVPGVRGLRYLFLRSSGSGTVWSACRVLVEAPDGPGGREVLAAVARELRRWGITHASVQGEVIGQEGGRARCLPGLRSLP
jgi:hypothetical protein